MGHGVGLEGRFVQHLHDLQGQALHFVMESVNPLVLILKLLVHLVPQEDEDGDAHTGLDAQRRHDHQQRLVNSRHRTG